MNDKIGKKSHTKVKKKRIWTVELTNTKTEHLKCVIKLTEVDKKANTQEKMIKSNNKKNE